MKNVLLGCLLISLLFLVSCKNEPKIVASKECIDYCRCMKTTCSSYEKYPNENEEHCLLACSKFNAQELTCWSYFCSQKDESMQEHLCEHASGEFGLDECSE